MVGKSSFAAPDRLIIQARFFNGCWHTEWGLGGDHHHILPQIACWLKGKECGSAVEVSGCHYLDSLGALDPTFDRVTRYCEDPDVVQCDVAISPMKYSCQHWVYSGFTYNFHFIGKREARGKTIRKSWKNLEASHFIDNQSRLFKN